MVIFTIYPRNAKTEKHENVYDMYENENTEDNATRDVSADNEMTNDDIFHNLTQTSDISPPHIPLITQILLRKISRDHTMKSIEEILESVPKSYRKHAHLLMKHLFRKAVPDR